ncbi:MAG: type II toxin-antitoxin system HicA family toxin [Candidatus Scalinduaceae bacterium]
MIHRLKNTPVRELIRALEQDGFRYKRRKGSQRVYRHYDGRRVIIHYHHAKDILLPALLKVSSMELNGMKTTSNVLN